LKKNNKTFSKKIIQNIKTLFYNINQSQRSKAIELTRFELRELENLFVLLLLGAFTGIPSPLSMLSVELLPFLEHELKVMNTRAKDADDALAELAGLLDIG
jgi:hypothetical protein